MEEQRMYVQVERDGGYSQIQVTGDIDGYVGARLAEAIDHCRRSGSSVTVDLRRVSSISLSGVKRLLGVSRGGDAEDLSYALRPDTEELMESLITWWTGVTRHRLNWDESAAVSSPNRLASAQPASPSTNA